MVLMPTNIDGLQSARTQIQDWVSLSEPRLSLFPPLESSGIVQTPKREGGEKNHWSCESKECVITVPLRYTSTAVYLAFSNACRLWVALPGSRGVGVLPCLHTNWQQSRLRGAKDL